MGSWKSPSFLKHTGASLQKGGERGEGGGEKEEERET